MIYPDKETYKKYSKQYNLIPVYKEIKADFETPISIFLKLKAKFLLESVERGSNVGRYSIIAVGKKTEIRLHGRKVRFLEFRDDIQISDEVYVLQNPMIKIREYFEKFKVSEDGNLPPFYGGAIGYLGYETIQYYENIPIKQTEDSIPDGILVIPEIVLVYDIVKRYVTVIVSSTPDSDCAQSYDSAVDRLNKISEKIKQPIENGSNEDGSHEISIKYEMTKDTFIENVKKCKEYIMDGEIVQAVYSQQLHVKTDSRPFELYRTLRSVNPSPYLFFLDFDDFYLIGSSPEVMVRVQNKEILLKPIAGTRKRGQ